MLLARRFASKITILEVPEIEVRETNGQWCVGFAEDIGEHKFDTKKEVAQELFGRHVSG